MVPADIVERCDDSCQCQYYWKLILDLFIFLAQVLSSFVLFVVLCYCIDTQFKHNHVFLCTFGFNFLMVQALLTMNTISNCTSSHRAWQRMYAHITLQLMAIIFIILGQIIVVTIDSGLTKSLHGILGIVSTFGAVLAVIVGIYSYFSSPLSYYIHKALGLFTLISSSACFTYGLKKPEFIDRFSIEGFKAWKWMAVCVVLYTLIIIMTIVLKFFLGCRCEGNEDKNADEDYDDEINEYVEQL